MLLGAAIFSLNSGMRTTDCTEYTDNEGIRETGGLTLWVGMVRLPKPVLILAYPRYPRFDCDF